MSSLFKNTNNTRQILPGSYRFIRSDVPLNITENEIQWLIENQILTIVDLRESSEYEQRICPLKNHPDFRYLHMPVTGGNVIPGAPDQVSAAYIRMVDEQMQKIIDTIWYAESNVLYFCSAGKDRTGVVSALLLIRAGANQQEIIEDYLESTDNLKDLLHMFARNHPEVDINVITPQKRYMEEFLAHFERI